MSQDSPNLHTHKQERWVKFHQTAETLPLCNASARRTLSRASFSTLRSISSSSSAVIFMSSCLRLCFSALNLVWVSSEASWSSAKIHFTVGFSATCISG